MTEPKRNSAWWLLFFAVVMSAIFFTEAYGQHECQGGHNCNENGGAVTVDNVLTGGDVVTGDNTISTRGGIAVSGSDMEIADSLATHSILFGLWQGTHTNPYAEADKLEAHGKYEAAAKMRCSTRKYSKVYGKGQECIDAVIYVEPEPTEITPQTPEDDARIEALYARLSEIEALRIQDKAEAEKAVESANTAAKRANAMARRVQTAPDDAAERRAKARAAMKGEQ